MATKFTNEQHASLVNLRDAIRGAHAQFPGHRDMGLLHGMAERLVAANKGNMSNDQYQALGGGTDKSADQQ